MRIEVFYSDLSKDGRAKRLHRKLGAVVGNDTALQAIVDVYFIGDDAGLDGDAAAKLFVDPVTQRVLVDRPALDDGLVFGWRFAVEIAYRPGVTDPVGVTARELIEKITGTQLALHVPVRTAKQYIFGGEAPLEANRETIVELLYNPLIESATVIDVAMWGGGSRFVSDYTGTVSPSRIDVETVAITGLDQDELRRLSSERLLALELEEMRAIQQYYGDASVRADRRTNGLPEEPTDVELEMIAQTWSEHCKHKILNAEVCYTEVAEDGVTVFEERIPSLFAEYIRGTTERLAPDKPFLKSVFHDNSGVIDFDGENLLCFKVETHNSPSALDPYGGAITGIVGVNRDILGTGKGARPIFNTDVLCFADPDTPDDEVPAGLLRPRQVMEGVHHGIIDGGNQSGIPVAAGAFVFDESYMGKPLVYCGTGGALPAAIGGEGAWIKHIDPGDLAVMVGGRIGKDGIHGATFSSLALDETSPTSAVQIGDPITQKKMSDFLLEARDLGLYKGVTDNGAGGLSSSLGEMAEESGGIRIDLDACPLKYEGLAPWEILVSESQERMSLAVHRDSLDALMDLAARRDVEATVVGRFTGDGYIDIYHRKQPVGRLGVAFLHDGLPRMRLRAHWRRKPVSYGRLPSGRSPGSDLLELLADPNIASKEPLVRRYDHEVQGGSVMKPFVGESADGPSDGAVLRPFRPSYRGITVTHGICPRYGDYDTYRMAACAVDEAYRAHIACGGDPDFAAALDNFCWPDPVESDRTPDGRYKMAQLVRACKGLQDSCLAYGIPLISGKDSMKNDTVADGKKISVRPTLLVSLMGVIEDIRRTVTTDFKQAGDVVFLLGRTRGELGGSAYERMIGIDMGASPEVDFTGALQLYRIYSEAVSAGEVASCHDLSEGGLGVAAAESAFGGRFGAEIDLDLVPGADIREMEPGRILFCESASRLLVSVRPESAASFEARFEGLPCRRIGTVVTAPRIEFHRSGASVAGVGIPEIAQAWKRLWD
jgi:phosphoribosylformylglycinamidine synthase subunit PurSL